LLRVGGYTEMVLRTLDGGDRRREDLQEVAHGAQRAAALTRQLLAVSRRQILQPTVLDVNGWSGTFKSSFVEPIPENIDLRLELSPGEDLDSKNGTYLRGARVKGPSRLVDGDEIHVGSAVVRFRMTSAVGSTATQGSR
jgi:signal transduction histidine kinase